MSTHTPGPWRIDQRWPGWHGAWICADKEPIATLCTSQANVENGEANAKLIAAAPEMHDLLREAIDAWPQFDLPGDEDCSVNGGDLVEWFGEWRKRAKEVAR